MSATLIDRLDELRTRLDQLPDPKEPPPTTLQILGRERTENDWQQLLFYLLSPDNAHGLEHALVEHILRAFSKRDDLDYRFSRFDLQDIQVEQEVTTAGGRPDAVIWADNEWFICWELKIGASESRGQTQAYVDVNSFRGIGLDKDEIPSENQFYVYLAPEGSHLPEANEFVPISWEWIASELQSFLADSHGEYPSRTTAQLDDFIDTIRSELTMTDYQENQQDKAELYVEYIEELSEVQNAFEARWEKFSETWGTKLADGVEEARLLEDIALPENSVAIEIDTGGEEEQRWIIRQGMSDWGGILKDGWWRSTEDLSPMYRYPDDEKLAGISYYHRLQHNRDLAVKDKILEIQFLHSSANSSEFKKSFNEVFTSRQEELITQLPPTASLANISDASWKLFTARYDIREEHYKDFNQAYVGALNEAFRDLAIENQELVSLIDEIYEVSLDIYRSK